MPNNVIKWCKCVRQPVEHQHVGLQDFGWAVMDVYQCTQCNTLKHFPVVQEPTLTNDRTDSLRQREPRSGTTRPLRLSSV